MIRVVHNCMAVIIIACMRFNIICYYYYNYVSCYIYFFVFSWPKPLAMFATCLLVDAEAE